MPRLAKFLKLSTVDKILALHCLFVVASVRIALSLFSYRLLRRLLRQKVSRMSFDVARADRIVRGAGRQLLEACSTCLLSDLRPSPPNSCLRVRAFDHKSALALQFTKRANL